MLRSAKLQRPLSGSGSVSDHIGTIQLTLLSRWGWLKRFYTRLGNMHVFYVWGVDFEECWALVYNNCVEIRFDLIFQSPFSDAVPISDLL